jgi:WD40 repeat protein
MVMNLFPLPDGRRALAVSYSGQVYYQHRLRLWDLETGAAIWTLPNPMKLMAVRPDVGQVLGIMDGAWRLWDVQTGTEVERVPAPAGWIDSAYWLPNLEQIIGITADGELRLWAIKTGVVLAGFGADAAIQSCALTPDGAVVVAGDSGGNLHFLRLVEQSGSESLRPAAWWQFWKKGPGETRAK